MVACPSVVGWHCLQNDPIPVYVGTGELPADMFPVRAVVADDQHFFSPADLLRDLDKNRFDLFQAFGPVAVRVWPREHYAALRRPFGRKVLAAGFAHRMQGILSENAAYANVASSYSPATKR